MRVVSAQHWGQSGQQEDTGGLFEECPLMQIRFTADREGS